jgi:rare lipoprotein A
LIAGAETAGGVSPGSAEDATRAAPTLAPEAGIGRSPPTGPIIRSAVMPLLRRFFHPPLVSFVVAAALVGCASAPKAPSSPATPSRPGYYKDDGPGEAPPANLDSIPDAQPKLEPLNRFANRPYSVFGREYVPATSLRPYKERGVASWYGRKFHGQKTSIGETYDMYAMSAAHPTLPLPSYARVTNVATGQSVVVRVNDRGPFLRDRLIDLSYAAAYRLGIAQKGSGEVEVEAIIPGEAVLVAAAPLPAVAEAPAAATPGALPAEAGATVPVASAEGGFAVQLGAFASYANAQNFVARLANQLAPVGVEARVRQVNGLFRVFVGPYPTREDARRVADRLRDALGLPSTIAVHG